MIDDIRARKLGRHSLRSHIHSCKRFAAFLKRSPETATADDVRRFQLTLIEEEGLTICNRNRIMTGVKFLLRVTMRRHDTDLNPPSASAFVAIGHGGRSGELALAAEKVWGAEDMPDIIVPCYDPVID